MVVTPFQYGIRGRIFPTLFLIQAPWIRHLLSSTARRTSIAVPIMNAWSPAATPSRAFARKSHQPLRRIVGRAIPAWLARRVQTVPVRGESLSYAMMAIHARKIPVIPPLVAKPVPLRTVVSLSARVRSADSTVVAVFAESVRLGSLA